MNRQWEDDAKLVAKYYTDKIAEKGYSAETLSSRDKKYTNMFYDELLTGIKVENNSSFLDVGSGLGLFVPYLEKRGIKVSDYLGVDLIPQFIDYSKETYPQYKFLLGNFISDDFSLDKKFDYVFALGVLVSRVNDYEEFLTKFIKKMVSYSNNYVLFNLITEVDADSPNYENKDKVGGITPISKDKLENILSSIPGTTFNIIEKRIFDDATDAFVQIKID